MSIFCHVVLLGAVLCFLLNIVNNVQKFLGKNKHVGTLHIQADKSHLKTMLTILIDESFLPIKLKLCPALHQLHTYIASLCHVNITLTLIVETCSCDKSRAQASHLVSIPLPLINMYLVPYYIFCCLNSSYLPCAHLFLSTL